MTQIVFDWHTSPQPPQLFLSLAVVVQVPPQQVCPLAQPPVAVQTQLPLLHAWPLGHECPQAPQLLASLLVFRQVPPQFVCPGWQVHCPFTQVVLAGHA